MSIAGEERLERNFSYQWASGVAPSVLSIVLAILVGGIIVLVSRQNPFNAYWQLAQGAFGGPYAISETLVSAIPLMLAGLAVAFAFRGGMFNIGAEGQLFIGAITSAWVGYHFTFPGYILIPLALLAGAIGGALWAGIAGVLKAWRGAHEVITTIMLNYTAIFISAYLLESTATGQPGPMEQHAQIGFPATPPMNASLPIIIPNSLIPNGRLHAGLLVALLAAFVFWFVLWRTTFGYRIRAVGLNPKAAAYAGMHVGWTITLCMVIAGAFAGLAGTVAIFGLYPYQLTTTFSPGYGFNAIAVALLGKNTAVGTVAAAILFGAFDHGGAVMQSSAGVPVDLVNILQGLIIFFVGADALTRYLARRGMVRLPRWQRRELST